MKKKPKTSWGKVAKWYDELLEKSPDTYQAKVILPNLLRLLEPRAGQALLDIACGQGFFTRALAARGASATGADISSELIALAKRASPASIPFHIAPADKLAFAKNKSFDTALIVLALQNIENLDGVIAEAARALKPGGRFLIVLNHPAFRIPGRSSWNWDEAAQAQYRRVDAYLSESRAKIEMHPGDDPGVHTISFHRPFQVYMKALAKHGFVIARLEEWNSHRRSQPGPRAKEEDRTRKEFPLFLCLEARLLP
ncbi:MAG TPA: class I SAM-dependent methyltransferase [Candidatus Paceibacterota bacterium]|nr:class I SAM-dependent methyltransferase [Candidatus Paceibacterota bacterium]